MPLLTGVMRFRIGLALSVLGLAGAVVGIYWDPINGRELASGSIGIMQALVTAGGAALCVLGAVLMVLPRRVPETPAPVKKTPKGAVAGLDGPPAKKKKKNKLARKRRRNSIRR